MLHALVRLAPSTIGLLKLQQAKAALAGSDCNCLKGASGVLCHSRESGTGTKLWTLRRFPRCGLFLAARAVASSHARACVVTVSGTWELRDTVEVVSRPRQKGTQRPSLNGMAPSLVVVARQALQ